MYLKLQNIGKFIESDIDINGLTVIAGENSTGKSTISKAFYAIFHGSYHIDERMADERKNSLTSVIFKAIGQDQSSNSIKKIMDAQKMASEIVDNISDYRKNPQKLEIFFSNKIDNARNDSHFDIDKLSSDTFRVLDVSDDSFKNQSIYRELYREFNNQIDNESTEDDGQITLQIKKHSLSVQHDRQEDAYIYHSDINIYNDVIYLDDPFVVDKLNLFANSMTNFPYGHQEDIISSLRESSNNTFDEIIAKDSLKKISKLIDNAGIGKLVQDNNSQWLMQEEDTKRNIHPENISTGMKTFLILKQLLLNGALTTDGVLILDEPEIHLHPKWQILLAEVIVLMQVEFNLHILMNTHSPFFLDAIETFSEKYGVKDKCKYYLAYNRENNAVIRDVSDDTTPIYQKLAEPIQWLENQK